MGDTRVTLDQLKTWLEIYRADVATNAAMLTELDSAIGDADHGTNMDRGMGAVVAAISPEGLAASGKSLNSIADLAKLTGMTLVSTVGGSAGPLYGTFFLRLGTGVTGTELSEVEFADALQRGLDGIVARGKAEPGDKTMFDALQPGIQALRDAVALGVPWRAALEAMAAAAEAGRDATIPMLARKGRASYLGERSIGHQDPGATSMAMLLRDAVETLS